MHHITPLVINALGANTQTHKLKEFQETRYALSLARPDPIFMQGVYTAHAFQAGAHTASDKRPAQK